MKLLIYPQSRDNSYQEDLYQNIKKEYYIKYKYLQHIPPIFLTMLFIYRLRGYNLFHLHWLDFNVPILKRINIKLSRKIDYFYSLFCIYLIKKIGFKIIWTVHNILPHEIKTSDDLSVTKYVIKNADSIIVHSNEALNKINKLENCKFKSNVIPHGNYDKIYDEKISREIARKKLGLPNKDFIYLFIGHVRPYKGVEDLIKSFKEIKKKDIKLIICGKPLNERYKLKIIKLANQNNIILKLEFIPEEELKFYLNACDITVFPFKSITTSGSVLLALSFRKPILYRDIGGLKELPDNIGYKYDKNLYGAMIKSYKGRKEMKKFQRPIIDYIGSLSWDKISKQTLEVYKKAIEKNNKSI